MRDWTNLLPASFRGVPFQVDSDDLSDGRRLARHEYAGGEATEIEDLGRKTPSFEVTAYVLGDFADAAAVALRSALVLPGPGMLLLPIDGGFLAYVDDIRRSRSKDRNGYIGFDITFVPAPPMPGLVLSIGDVISAVADGLGLIADVLGAILGGVADVVGIVGWVADLASAIITDADDLATVTTSLFDLGSLSSSSAAGGAAYDPVTAAPVLLDAIRIVAESVTDSTGFDTITIPDTFGAGPQRDVMTIMLAVGLSIAAVRADWPSRQSARKARKRVSVTGDDALAIASSLGGNGADAYGAISAIVEVSCQLLSEIAANSVPVVKVQTGISLPSTVLAYQLYGDAQRADGLVDIAGSATPLVMPTLFDALAS